jgi:hypothetical protein
MEQMQRFLEKFVRSGHGLRLYQRRILKMGVERPFARQSRARHGHKVVPFASAA